MLSYGRHIVFVIESKLPIRGGQTANLKKFGSNASQIRLKGQMKLMTAWNTIAFLCHPVYVLELCIILFTEKYRFIYM